jgi:hypothetical protein
VGEFIEYIIKGENILHLEYLAENNSNELVIIGSKKPIHFDMNTLRNNFNLLTEYDISYLSLTNLDSIDRIYNLLLFRGEDIKGYYKGSNLVTDDKPILEFSSPINHIKKLSRTESPTMDDILNYLRSVKDGKKPRHG